MNFRFAFRRQNKNQKSRTSRPTFDILETREMLSATSLVLGTVFRDVNTNGIHDSTESGLSGQTVFADVNGNGQVDSGEISTTTDAGGNYTLDLPPGQYT